jgi:hypothetical protein
MLPLARTAHTRIRLLLTKWIECVGKVVRQVGVKGRGNRRPEPAPNRVSRPANIPGSPRGESHTAGAARRLQRARTTRKSPALNPSQKKSRVRNLDPAWREGHGSGERSPK